MAKKNKKAKKSKRTKYWYDKKYSAYDLAKKAAQGVYYLKGLVNSELFKHDGAASITPSTTGTVIPITAIAQGDGVAARTGLSIFVRSLNLNMKLVHNNAGTPGQAVNVFIICDTQQVGDTAPTFSQIFAGNDVNTMLNVEQVGRFKIMKRMRITCSSDTPTVQRTLFYRMRLHVRYNGTGSGDIQKCGMYIVVVSDQTTNLPTFTYFYRLSYHDN